MAKNINKGKGLPENNGSNKEGKTAKTRSLHAAIISRLIKAILIWIPIAIVTLLIIVLIALKLYLSPDRVQDLIASNFSDLSYGSISLKVKDFSPYSGFEIHDLLIRNGDEFGRTKFVEIKRLVLRYSFFSLLIGNIRFEEIGIYKPRIYLTEKNGVWNATRLMRPGEKKPEEEEEKIKEAEGPPLEEINLPISVEFLFKFFLEDLNLYVKGSNFKSSIEGLTYNMDIWMPPFKQIPMSIKAVTLLDRMNFALNPSGSMNVFFSSIEGEFNSPLMLNWQLVFGKEAEKKSTFMSNFKFGAYKAPVRFKRTHLAPLNFMVSYDMYYNPLNDHLKLSHLGIEFLGKKWLRLSGNIKKVSTSQKIDLRMTESNIVLSDLYPYFRSITGDRTTKFNGIISLYPLILKGTPNNLNIQGEINLKRIFFKNPSAKAEIPSLTLSYSVAKKSNDMLISSLLKIPHLFYTLERDKSGDNGLEMRANVAAFNNFQKVNIRKFTLRFYDPASKKSALKLALIGNVKLKPDMSGNIKITRFTFLKKPLLGMLPQKIKKSLAAVPLSKPVDMNLGLQFALGDAIKANLRMLIKVPDFNINDLKLSAKVIQDNREQRLALKSFTMGTKTLGLSISANGTLDMKSQPFSDSDLKLTVKLDSPEMKPIYGPWELSGLFQLAANMKGDLKTGKAYGSIEIDKLFVKNDESKLSVEDVNLDFPFEYYFASTGPGASRIAVEKSQVIDNEKFKEKENFSIRSIKAGHPARKIQFEYLKDFAATMFFRNNTFELIKLKAYVLDGAVYGRDILFNLADMPHTGSFKNVEYRLILDVTNVDIGKLDNPDPAVKSRDAELSLNANFTGTGLDMFIGKGKDRGKELNVKGYINIHKVGEKFSNKLFKGLSEERGQSTLGIAQFAVDSSVSIKGFNYNLDTGLMYVKVSFIRKGFIGYIITVENILFDRVPIQNYLRSISTG